MLAAAYACVARFGIGKTTIDDVAREAGRSRATIYRYFPGGKDELIRETVAWDVSRFYARFVEIMHAPDPFADVLERALVFVWRSAGEHELLQRLLAGEPEEIVPLLTLEAPTAHEMAAALIRTRLERERDAGWVRPDVDLGEAADYVARMLLSFVSARGSWDFDDAAETSFVVREQVLVGILRPDALVA